MIPLLPRHSSLTPLSLYIIPMSSLGFCSWPLLSSLNNPCLPSLTRYDSSPPTSFLSHTSLTPLSHHIILLFSLGMSLTSYSTYFFHTFPFPVILLILPSPLDPYHSYLTPFISPDSLSDETLNRGSVLRCFSPSTFKNQAELSVVSSCILALSPVTTNRLLGASLRWAACSDLLRLSFFSHRFPFLCHSFLRPLIPF